VAPGALGAADGAEPRWAGRGVGVDAEGGSLGAGIPGGGMNRGGAEGGADAGAEAPGGEVWDPPALVPVPSGAAGMGATVGRVTVPPTLTPAGAATPAPEVESAGPAGPPVPGRGSSRLSAPTPPLPLKQPPAGGGTTVTWRASSNPEPSCRPWAAAHLPSPTSAVVASPR
jgi:hypothetical protein